MLYDDHRRVTQMTKASLVINFSVPIYLLLLFASATEDNVVLDLQTAFWV